MNTTTRSRSKAVRRFAVAGIAVVALAVAATSAVSTAFAASAVPTQVLGSGSDVMFHVQSALDQLYNESPGCNITVASGTQPLDFHCIPASGDITTEDYLHDRISEAFPIGGGAGVKQLCAQGTAGVAKISFVRQTSAPDATVCTGLSYLAYARDGITWESFPNVAGSATTGVHSLTTAQLQGIFVNCTITNWNQVGGSNAPIQIYSILGIYGTRKAFDGFLGGSSSSCPGVKLIDQTANNEIAAADLKNAIVPVSVGSWTERYGAGGNPDGSVINSIDGVTPTEAHIADGSFTFSRFLYDVFCGAATCGTAKKAAKPVTNFVGANGWICKVAHADDPTTGVDYHTEIANTIRQYGFAPLPSGPQGGGSTFTNYCRFAKS